MFFCLLSFLSHAAANKTIGISQIVEHPALDAVREGLLEQLKSEGYVAGQNLTVLNENAQGSVVTATQIANKLLSQPLDVGVAISTPSAQTLFFAAQKQHKTIPIVFSAVSDPKAAKLESPNQQYPITGVTDTPNLEALLELIEKMMPKLKTLGLLYNPSEANSASTIAKLNKLLADKKIKSFEVTVNKTADVTQAMQSLIGKVDALYFPQDNTVVAAIDTVVGIANQSSPALPVILPIFTSDPILVEKGVLAAVGFDYHTVGVETGKVIAKILNGESANQIPVHSPKEVKTVINRTLAKKMDLPIPEKLQHSKITFVDN